ncbi:MAG: cell division protein ZipA [Proteobacteria bacterium]|nr:cell division protein ZipA [Pseudomonadota bacterium]
MSDLHLVQLIIAGACLLMIALIWFFRPGKPKQGRRVASRDDAPAGSRAEPTLGEEIERGLKEDRAVADGGGDAAVGAASGGDAPAESDAGAAPAASSARTPRGSHPHLGIRQDEAFDRIVTLFVAARAGRMLTGPDLVVAAEKAGLVHGHMSIYHRLVDGKPEAGPVFSVANMIKPGNFDLTRLHELRTPGISFFLTLPAPRPLSALDAWDAMLPTAQRMAELLDALVLDEERNALGRQRIAHIRDEMRAYDRRREQQVIRPGR